MTALATAALPTIKTALGVNDTSRDTELLALAERAISAIGGYLGRPVVPTECEDSFTEICGPLLLPSFPVSPDDVSVTCNGAVLSPGSFRVFARTGTVWRQQGNCLKYFFSTDTVDVAYTGGNYVYPYPDWLMQSVVQTTLSLEADGGSGVAQGEVRREAIAGVYSVDYGTSGSDSYGFIPAVAIDFLREHRAPGAANNG